MAVKVSTSIWSDPEWLGLTDSAQLFAFGCMAVGANGAATNARIAKLTGWDEAFIERGREALEGTPFAHLLIGNRKRRKLPRIVVATVMARDGIRCVKCGSTERLEIDHKHPVARGGSDDLDNLQVMCVPCNRRKGARVA